MRPLFAPFMPAAPHVHILLAPFTPRPPHSHHASPFQIRKEKLSTDFNCSYWQKRFTLRPEQTPAFLEEHAQAGDGP